MHPPETSGLLFYRDQIVLANDLDELEKLTDWINHLAEELVDIPAQINFRLELVLSEAITNIIENAYEDPNPHSIKIDLQYHENKIMIQVEDDGIPFNPLDNPEVEFADTLEDVKIGGLGIHLIRSYSNECYYQREDNRNILDLIIYDEQV